MGFPLGLQLPEKFRPTCPSDLFPTDTASMSRDDFIRNFPTAMGATEHVDILQRGSQLFKAEKCITSRYLWELYITTPAFSEAPEPPVKRALSPLFNAIFPGI
jgi:hypothetical protein